MRQTARGAGYRAVILIIRRVVNRKHITPKTRRQAQIASVSVHRFDPVHTLPGDQKPLAGTGDRGPFQAVGGRVRNQGRGNC